MIVVENNLDVTKIVDDNFRHTCLFYAAFIKDPKAYYSLLYNRGQEVMKFLIEKGISPTYTDTLRQTALYYVAREGKLSCVEMLVKKGNISFITLKAVILIVVINMDKHLYIMLHVKDTMKWRRN